MTYYDFLPVTKSKEFELSNVSGWQDWKPSYWHYYQHRDMSGADGR